MAYSFVNIEVLKKPLIPETLRKIPRGKSCRFTCKELGQLTSVQSAIYRLNKQGLNLVLEIINNGESYIITNN